MNLKEVVLCGESESLEFKESLQLKDEIGESISSFSNSKGGVILIGVSDKREIRGVQIGKKTVTDLAEYAKRNTDPQIFPEIKVCEIDNKKTISIKVTESTEKPVFFKSYAYKRVGDTNQRISSSEIRRLAKEPGSKGYWDEQICGEARLEDINEKKVRQFLGKARFERRLDIAPGISIREILERLNLIKNSKLTNAAVLLFGRNPQRFFLQVEVRCARFKGTKPLEFIDMKVFGGDTIDQREDGLEFIKEHIKLHAEIKGTERVERWEYPIEAIREAITNAICHRDYESTANVQIRIFDDRIEIWNPGNLLNGLTVQKLKGKHESVLRSPLLAKNFFLIKYIEQWGTGTNRMIEWCLNYDFPEPVFEEIGGSFVVTIKKYKITEEVLLSLDERQKKAVEYLLKNKKITNKEYRELSPNISDRTALNDLNELVAREIIMAVGAKKNRYYILR